ncbi:splicing factor 3B subunit 1-like [Dorcoceras hygrometricum]|uniref:Splicing factor 3B subunit 1-like n=1 Tax=Dorcoceras hygrometricum TaxID=472368 RepID=A0A2Z7CG98_9LAMI|nr:splicing factor 3B subunit 1-like [Dorcoceras hygrometricum]
METDMEEPSFTRSDDIIVEITTRQIAVNDEDDNLDGAENESSRKMASFTAPKQFLKEPLRSGEDDDMSGLKQQPHSAIDLQVVDILSDVHLFVLEELQKQIQQHGLKWERESNSRLFEEGNDLWQRLPKPVASLELELPPQRQFESTLAPVSDFFRIIRKRWADVCIGIVQFSASGRLQPVDVQLILSDSSSSSSSHSDPISPNDGLSQRHLDTALISPNPSLSTDSRIFFTTNDTPLGVDQILLPSAITPQDFNEPLAQLRASVNQIHTERVQKRDDAEKLKEELLLHIRILEQRFTEILDQQDRTYRGLFTHVSLSQVYDDKLTKIQDRQDALSHEIMEFRVKAQENYKHLTSQFSELVDYINRGRDDKKGKSGSSRGPQPPPDDRGRPGSGDRGSRSGGGSRSETARNLGGGGNSGFTAGRGFSPAGGAPGGG